MSRSESRYHHGDLASALEAAADSLLAERGAASLSLREVARRAGVSHNAPYHHFADRHALLQRLGVRHMTRLVEAQRAAGERETDARAAFVAMGAAYVGYAHEHPHGFAVIFDPEVCVPGETGPQMTTLIAENEALIGAAIARVAPELGEQEIEAAVVGAWGAAHGLAQLVAAGHVPIDAVRPAFEAYLAMGATLTRTP
ncbi:TetR/AcrR family transcriptional regulator [Agrococcus jejuensis]|uniref:TetR/AcrR family transcriptional regulator n=1 Tax=Agrococcus jejuensis TaxID=399736 RepID=UPI00119FFACA|nr:TetR/AcrR family transcriptional regulator [Agrococcus jejuensis]